MKVVTSFQTLMHYAYELGQARLSGDSARIAEAQRKHDEYAQACLESDEMMLGGTVGELFSPLESRSERVAP